jgi:hypothetical protein
MLTSVLTWTNIYYSICVVPFTRVSLLGACFFNIDLDTHLPAATPYLLFRIPDQICMNFPTYTFYTVLHDLAIAVTGPFVQELKLWSSSLCGSRDSVVGIATTYRLDDRGVGVRVPVESRIFSSPDRPDRLLRSTQPPIQWVPGALSPGVKRPGRGVDHSPPTSAEVKKMWIYTSTPTYAFMA